MRSHLPRAKPVGALPGTAFAVVFAAALTGLAQEPPGIEQINALAGAPLFADENLWDDSAEEAARRLALPRESETSATASFRAYCGPDARFFGARAYTVSMQAAGGKPTEVSFIFANKGDFGELYSKNRALELALRSGDRSSARSYEKVIRDLMKQLGPALESDAKTVEAAVTAVIGPPKPARMGEVAGLREKALRWDWKGHAFILSHQEEEYVGLKIMPPEAADAGGKTARISDAQLKEIIRSRVVKRENGDVIITDIPMVDQGPKGFCVPATWERYLRYVGIPADMYLLAMAGQTAAGGGTYFEEIARAVDGLARRKGRSIESVRTSSLDSARIAGQINNGLPIMWGMFVDDALSDKIQKRTAERAGMTSPDEWKKRLEEDRKLARKLKPNPQNGHVCMIIGYNSATGELAVSDSWGPAYKERWWLVEEAEALSQGYLQVIKW